MDSLVRMLSSISSTKYRVKVRRLHQFNSNTKNDAPVRDLWAFWLINRVTFCWGLCRSSNTNHITPNQKFNFKYQLPFLSSETCNWFLIEIIQDGSKEILFMSSWMSLIQIISSLELQTVKRIVILRWDILLTLRYSYVSLTLNMQILMWL